MRFRGFFPVSPGAFLAAFVLGAVSIAGALCGMSKAGWKTLWRAWISRPASFRCTEAHPDGLPFPDLAPSDYLAANLRKALHRQAELLDLPVDPADPRVGRLIADVANQTVNAVVRAQGASLAAKRDDDHDRAMEALIEERRQKALLAI